MVRLGPLQPLDQSRIPVFHDTARGVDVGFRNVVARVVLSPRAERPSESKRTLQSPIYVGGAGVLTLFFINMQEPRAVTLNTGPEGSNKFGRGRTTEGQVKS